ncbi:bifunctional 5,10-methylenetetrahydrofolate dehydrogenase/5,10-methenyltetrahydrofolate cyclohydrolase [Candidatus Gracilibacteria bacterium]|nr:bifunctional 5,10-methylenetetrahydrofolate dehydrogenase/5,10-methenyltetrahydrofolate cyclohydrolase [Candidatus Gracilibacteria bacterium]
MILDIKTLAHGIIGEIEMTVKKLNTKPSLTIIMAGNNSASEVYVRNKIKTCESIAIKTALIHLPEDISQTELKDHIHKLNTDETVHGILVQSPLPGNISAQEIFDIIHPLKDVDGFCSTNIAHLYSGDETGLIPGTPKGIMKIIEHYLETKHSSIEGKHAVVIGKSTIVGKPLSLMLMHAGATVTVCHSRTKDLSAHTKNADIIISAVGKKDIITTDMVKPGALVIDVGINVTDDESRKLSGDCETGSICEIADITPVPGGVGPMTIAMLLSNVLLAHSLQGKN